MQGFRLRIGMVPSGFFKKNIKFDVRVCSYTIIRIFAFKFLIVIYIDFYIYMFFLK